MSQRLTGLVRTNAHSSASWHLDEVKMHEPIRGPVRIVRRTRDLWFLEKKGQTSFLSKKGISELTLKNCPQNGANCSLFLIAPSSLIEIKCESVAPNPSLFLKA